ncbi:calmodulin (CaM) [Schistosoma japonicum]|nr:calmodulin (CaM) [Schistosoma japonicum]
MFETADIDKSGKLSMNEVKKLLENEYDSEFSDEFIQQFMAEHDVDGDQEWSIDELAEVFASKQ